MAMERVPYLVGGGFEHSAEVMRAMLAAATSGAEGLVNAGDMKVSSLSVPGTSVRVGPGNALIRNSYTGGVAQTYACRASSETELAIQATGSAGGRADLIVARIDDPTYQGGAFDPVTFEAARFEIIRGVSSSQAGVAGLGLSYPAIPLARLNIPASTGTITAGMVTDLRFLAQPRKERHLFIYPLGAGDGEIPLTNKTEAGMWWPNPATVANWRVDVPEWAQRVRLLGQWGGVMLNGGGGNAWGRAWVRIGSQDDSAGIDSQEVSWDTTGYQATNSREAWLTGADRYVPVGIRGTNQVLGLRGRVIHRDTAASLPIINSLSVVSLDVEFYETAV